MFLTEKLLVPQQPGYREHHFTEDQTTYLAQETEDEFQRKKQTLSVWIDLEKTFDKVGTDGILLKLRRCNLAGNMFKWIKL